MDGHNLTPGASQHEGLINIKLKLAPRSLRRYKGNKYTREYLKASTGAILGHEKGLYTSP